LYDTNKLSEAIEIPVHNHNYLQSDCGLNQNNHKESELHEGRESHVFQLVKSTDYSDTFVVGFGYRKLVNKNKGINKSNNNMLFNDI